MAVPGGAGGHAPPSGMVAPPVGEKWKKSSGKNGKIVSKNWENCSGKNWEKSWKKEKIINLWIILYAYCSTSARRAAPQVSLPSPTPSLYLRESRSALSWGDLIRFFRAVVAIFYDKRIKNGKIEQNLYRIVNTGIFRGGGGGRFFKITKHT